MITLMPIFDFITLFNTSIMLCIPVIDMLYVLDYVNDGAQPQHFNINHGNSNII